MTTNDAPGAADLTAFITRRLIGATRNSLNGLRTLWREEAFRVEMALFAVLAPLGLWLGDGALERAALVGSLIVVLIVEALNTAVEAAINRISLDFHPLSGQSKDLGSAAVMLAMMLAGIVWALILVG